MIARSMEAKLKELARVFPVVTIEGPRQSGKTTLARMAFPEYGYVNLEDHVVRRLAEDDPRAFFQQFKTPLIVDEIQRVPGLLGEIQVIVDGNPANGQFVLTGSHQPRLKEGIAQSLAGRTALLTLYPLSIAELGGAGIECSRDEYLYNGFMPAIYNRGQNPSDAYEAYYRTYVERDVRQLVNIAHQREFELFLRLLAGRIGQVANLDSMSCEVGISSTTLKEWLSVLEASFVIYRLVPYYDNFGKRFIKAPKLYFTDVGLAAHLLGIESPTQIARDPLVGGLFENMVVMEAVKALANHGRPRALYYMRHKTGEEVDLAIEHRRRLHLFEIKSASTPNQSMASNMFKYRGWTDSIATGHVIYSGEEWPLEGGGFVNFTRFAGLIDAIMDDK